MNKLVDDSLILGKPVSSALATWSTSEKSMVLNDASGQEFIKVNSEGEAFVRGEKVAAGQQEVYEAFKAWVMKVAGPVTIPTTLYFDTDKCLAQLRKRVGEHGLPVKMLPLDDESGD